MGNRLGWIITLTDMPYRVHSMILEVKVLPLPCYVQRKYTDFNVKFKEKNLRGQCLRTSMLGKGYVTPQTLSLGFAPYKVLNNFDECFASIYDAQIENS